MPGDDAGYDLQPQRIVVVGVVVVFGVEAGPKEFCGGVEARSSFY